MRLLLITAFAAVLSTGLCGVSNAGDRYHAVQSDDAGIVNGDWGVGPGFIRESTGAVIPRIVRGWRAYYQVSAALWIRGLAGDREVVYSREGFPVFRYYENFAGDLTEVWTYPRSERRYTFRDDALIRVERFGSVAFADLRHHSATYRSGYAGRDIPPTSRTSSIDR